MKDTCRKDITKELRKIRSYEKPKMYAMISATFDEKAEAAPKKLYYQN